MKLIMRKLPAEMKESGGDTEAAYGWASIESLCDSRDVDSHSESWLTIGYSPVLLQGTPDLNGILFTPELLQRCFWVIIPVTLRRPR